MRMVRKERLSGKLLTGRCRLSSQWSEICTRMYWLLPAGDKHTSNRKQSIRYLNEHTRIYSSPGVVFGRGLDVTGVFHSCSRGSAGCKFMNAGKGLTVASYSPCCQGPHCIYLLHLEPSGTVVLNVDDSGKTCQQRL